MTDNIKHKMIKKELNKTRKKILEIYKQYLVLNQQMIVIYKLQKKQLLHIILYEML